MTALQQDTESFTHPLKVLHLEDSDADHWLLKRALANSGIASHITRAETKDALIECLHREHFDIILMDYRLPGFTALDVWAELSKMPTHPPCVLVSGTIGEAAAVTAIQTGISDYLHKDHVKEIGRVVLRALKAHRNELERAQAAHNLLQSEQRITELARHLQTSLEEERAAISREIHDEIGGSLAAIKLDVAWLKRHTTDASMLLRLESMQEMVGLALTATQRIMQNTRPDILNQGLAASVQWLTEAHARRLGSVVELRCDLSLKVPLSDGLRLTAYRTVQESLTNISKYAPDASVMVELSDEGGVLTVEVSDNGPGFSAEELSKTLGFGLKGLGERAKTIGGWLDISSAKTRGTSITLTVPLSTLTPHRPEAGSP
jgi:two-component system, NarL family, sensor histidine kinase UhpB